MLSPSSYCFTCPQKESKTILIDPKVIKGSVKHWHNREGVVELVVQQVYTNLICQETGISLKKE